MPQIKQLLLSFLLLFNFTTGGAQLYNPVPNDFPIIAWYSLEPNFINHREFKNLKKSGFNIALTAPLTGQETLEALRLAENSGVKLIIDCRETRIIDTSFIERVKTIKSFEQYYLSDEPSENNFSYLREKQQCFDESDSIHQPYINLLPIYASKEQLGVDTYEDYITRYINIFKPQYISFDNYPFVRDEFRRDYYDNLSVVSRICKEKELPFWGFVRTLTDSNYWAIDEGRIRFQVYTNIAYGAQGLQFFTYSIPKGCQRAIVGINHERTDLFYVVTAINKEIHKLSKYFLGANFTKVIHTDNIGKNDGILPNPIKALESQDSYLILSFFEKDGCNYLLVVNKDYVKDNRFNISFDHKTSIITKRGKKRIGKEHYSIVIKPGDGIVFQL